MGEQVNMSNTTLSSKSKTGIQKVATQIEGLDEILMGGLPRGRTTLVGGGPGTGKSILGMEFIYRGALSGHPGIFLTFEETGENIRRNARTLDWDLSFLEQEGMLFLIEGWIDPHVLLSGDFDMRGLLAIIEGKAGQMDARRIVIDAVDMLMRVFDTQKQQENEIFTLHKWLKDRGMTAVLTTKKRTQMSLSHDYLDFMADCVIYLDQRVKEQVNTKRLQVIKYRGSGYGENEYPFLISGDGLYFDPISDVEMRYEHVSDRISSGNPSLDTILGGGYKKGACILISGLTGTGKTTLGCTFACSASREDQKILYVNFEESRDGMVAGMLSLGIDLRPGIENGVLEIMSVMPEAMGIEEHLFRIKRVIKQFNPQHLVLDAISALKRIAGEAAAFDFLLRLVDVCKKTGLTTILINQARGSSEEHEFSGIGISSVIDTVITLHFKDTETGFSRVLLVRKSRGSKHSNKYHVFSLTDRGIQIE